MMRSERVCVSRFTAVVLRLGSVNVNMTIRGVTIRGQVKGGVSKKV